MTDLSILIPTTGRRESLLWRVTCAHHIETPGAEILTVQGKTWGAGLNELAQQAAGSYWLTICDDTLPHPGWFDAARTLVDQGLTPATRYFTVDGQPLRPGTDDAPHMTPIPWCRSFLLTPALFAEVGPFIDTTWYADIDYSERLTAASHPIFACDGFTFTHLDGERDWQTDEEDARERAEYAASVAKRGGGEVR